MGQAPEISVVAPCYNEQDSIKEFIDRLFIVLSGLNESVEVILVNDGSQDDTLEISKNLQKEHKEIIILNLSRNFGHQAAVTAGLDHASGNSVVIIDADLQDPPEVIPEMIEKWKEGFQVVYGARAERKGETFFKRITAKIFYRLIARMTGNLIPLDTGDYRLMDKTVANVLRNMPEKHRFIRGMVSWVGFKQTPVYYERDQRFAGDTKYSLKKMILFALDAITSFSTVPLQIITVLGMLVVFISILGSFLIFSVRIFFPDYFIPGYSSLILILLFFGGVQLVSLGLIGEYVGRIFGEVKNRPLYVIESIIENQN